MEDKLGLQSRATEKYYDKIFEEIKEPWKKRIQKKL